LGFYPVCPVGGYYAIASPLFKQVVVRLSGGKKFTILAHHVSSKNIYIQSARLNGKPFNQCWIRHHTILNGGKLEFVMGSKPEKTWGISGIPEKASSLLN
jgi:putative alpha-1,2-mannosidase